MKAQTKKLIETVKTLKKVAPRKASMPILSNLAVLADDLGLRFQTTDLDVTATQNVLVSQDFKKATYLVNPSELLDFLQASEAFETTFEQLDNELFIKTDGITKRLKSVDNEWPICTKDLNLDYTLNLTGLSSVAKAVSDDNLRYHLSGVYFDADKNCMVAVDGHRLHKQEISGILTPLDSFIMPKLAVKLLESENEVRMSRLSSGFVECQLDDGLLLTIRAVEGKFPNYQQLIPSTFKHSIKGSSEAFSKVLRKASKLADKKSRSIAFEGNTIECSKDMTIELKDIDNSIQEGIYNPRIGFNCDYLLEAIEQTDSKELAIQINDKHSPCFLKSGNFEAVIMPMKV